MDQVDTIEITIKLTNMDLRIKIIVVCLKLNSLRENSRDRRRTRRLVQLKELFWRRCRELITKTCILISTIQLLILLRIFYRLEMTI